MGTMSNRVRDLHEMACSANLALALACWFFALGPYTAQLALDEMNTGIYHWLGLKHDNDPHAKLEPEHGSPYVAFGVPTVAAAVLIWTALRLSAASSLSHWFLRSGAGITALVATPGVRLYYLANYSPGGLYGPGVHGWFIFTALEVTTVLALGLTRLCAKRSIPDNLLLFVIALHYGFWFWYYRLDFFFGQFGDPAGFCAGWAWVYYLRRQGITAGNPQGA
jgi:hypothetical protein